METVAYVVGLALTGLLVGAVGRLALPGRDPMSIFETMLVGVAGTLIAGLISYYLFERAPVAGLLLSILAAIGIVYGVRKLRERQLGPAAAPTRTGSVAGPFGGGGVQTTQVRFFPGCLVGSLLISLFLTLVLNLLIRAF